MGNPNTTTTPTIITTNTKINTNATTNHIKVSQYPYEEELLYPPCTYLTCKSSTKTGNIRYLIMTASVSTARPNLKNIFTVKDYDNDDDCLDYLIETTCLDNLFDATISQYQKFALKIKRKNNVRKIVVEA